MLHVKVHAIEGFSHSAGFMDTADPYVKLALGAEKGQTSKKNNAGGTVVFDETVTFWRKKLFDSLLRIAVMDSDGYLTECTDDTMGENVFDINLLDLQPGEERGDVVVEMKKKGAKSPQLKIDVCSFGGLPRAVQEP